MILFIVSLSSKQYRPSASQPIKLSKKFTLKSIPATSLNFIFTLTFLPLASSCIFDTMITFEPIFLLQGLTSILGILASKFAKIRFAFIIIITPSIPICRVYHHTPKPARNSISGKRDRRYAGWQVKNRTAAMQRGGSPVGGGSSCGFGRIQQGDLAGKDVFSRAALGQHERQRV